MYSREERTKAMELFIRYDLSTADTIRELGYPGWKTLHVWYEHYLEGQRTGIAWQPKLRKYSAIEKGRAVAYYLEHGGNLARTTKKPGYPSEACISPYGLTS